LEKYKDAISSDPHYYLTMASIVQLEGTNTENRKKIVGTFKNRLNSGYNMGSDVTTYYALQVDMKEDLKAEQFATVNPYNTRGANMIGKMPIGPICNPSVSSIEASVYPEENDYLFFVADKHGNIYFTKTNAEPYRPSAPFCIFLLRDYLHLLWIWRVRYEPTTITEVPDDRYVEACKNIPIAQNLLDELRDNNPVFQDQALSVLRQNENWKKLQDYVNKYKKEGDACGEGTNNHCA
jgi:hypothetical protein